MGYDVKSGWNLPKGSGDVTHFPTEEEAEEYAYQKEILDRGETIHVWDIEMGYDLGIIRRR